METLTEEQSEELRGALEAEKDSVEEELATYGRVQSSTGDWSGQSDSEGEEADPADAADNIEELAINMPLVEELEKRHRDIASALRRMDDGGYGLCDVCGETIPFDRLEANPAANTCINHVGLD